MNKWLKFNFKCWYFAVNASWCHWLACGVWWSLWCKVYSEASLLLGALNLLVGMGLNTIPFLNHLFTKNKKNIKNQNRCPLVALVCLSAGRCFLGMSVYNCVEMTRCSASGGAYGAIGETAYAGAGKGTYPWPARAGEFRQVMADVVDCWQVLELTSNLHNAHV